MIRFFLLGVRKNILVHKKLSPHKVRQVWKVVNLVEFQLFVMESTINSIDSFNITKVLYMSSSFGLLGV